MVYRSFLLVLAVCGIAVADTGFKDSIQFSESDGSPKCMAGQVVVNSGQLTCSGNKATLNITGGGGGGSSSLQVTRSGVEITSPTASINFYSGDFLGSSVGSTTSYMFLNPATTNYIRNNSSVQSATFYVSSGTVNDFFRFGSSNNSQETSYRQSTLPVNGGIGPQIVYTYMYSKQIQDSSLTGGFLLIASTEPYASYLTNTTDASYILISAPSIGIPKGSITLNGPVSAIAPGGLTVTYGVSAATGTFSAALTLPNGTGPTVDAIGKIALDTTQNQLLVYDGVSAKVVGSSTQCFSVNVSSGLGFNGLNEPIWSAPPETSITLTQITAWSLPSGTTVVYQLDEAASAFDSAGTDVFSIAYSSGNYTSVVTNSFSNAGIAAGASLVLNCPATAATGGTPRSLYLQICYMKDRQ